MFGTDNEKSFEVTGYMLKSYLVLQRGVLEEVVFPIEGRLTLGRSPINLVHLTDQSVSRRHAVIYELGGENVIEDLGSHNGTYLNGERVQKAVLRNGDVIKLGNVTLIYKEEPIVESEDGRITQEILSMTQEVMVSTEDLDHVTISSGYDTVAEPSYRSRRLQDALSKCVLFSPIDQRALEVVVKHAKILIFDKGRTVFREGDRGNSLFVVLEGVVRVFTYDQAGREIHLALLGENQFFGEMSFVSGEPRNATVQVLEESLICEVGFNVVKGLVERWPQVGEILRRYHQERLEVMEARKRAAGLVERRRHPRLNERIPVSFSISAGGAVHGQFKGRVFRTVSRDLSVGGIKIQVQDRALFALPMGSQLRMEIGLPRPWGAIRAIGVVKSLLEGKEGADIGFIGIEFHEMSQVHRRKLEGFLQGTTPTQS